MNKLVQPYRRDFKRKYTWTLKDVVEHFNVGKILKAAHDLKECGICKKEANKHE